MVLNSAKQHNLAQKEKDRNSTNKNKKFITNTVHPKFPKLRFIISIGFFFFLSKAKLVSRPVTPASTILVFKFWMIDKINHRSINDLLLIKFLEAAV